MSRLFGKEVRPIPEEISEKIAFDNPQPLATFQIPVKPSGMKTFWFNYGSNILYIDVLEDHPDGFPDQRYVAITSKTKGDLAKWWKLTRKQRRRIRQNSLRRFVDRLRATVTSLLEKPRPAVEVNIDPLISEVVSTAKTDVDGVPLIDKVLRHPIPPEGARGEGKLDPFNGAQIAQYYGGLSDLNIGGK